MNVTVSVPVAKYVNELYADVFARTYGFNIPLNSCHVLTSFVW